ncbi:HWE histidine kinase domain-containing protein [Prosthecomicrobium sp. N25]|uniref:HWE histidine kinase domain-containing protein n=1 Tax=Prosthecomicrobium sp. N25 TaxID=3129254 RepID=UPI003076A425
MSAVAAAEAAELVSDLRRRLEEAEDTLRAIREGEVDALVVRGEAEDNVYMIGDSTEAYRNFMEAMVPGAAATDGAGRILYANSALCGLLHASLPALQGRRLADLFGPGAARAVEEVVIGSADGRASAPVTLGSGEEEIVYQVAATPVRLGTIMGRAVTFSDLTERVRAERAERAERAALAILSSANEAVIVCDRTGVITHANAASAEALGADLVGRPFEEAIPLAFGVSGEVRSARDLIERALGGESIRGSEVFAPEALGPKDFLVSAAPLRISAGETAGCVLTLFDLSQRKAAEKHQQFLMQELDHRVKNTLAIVVSISKRTASSKDNLVDFQEAFTARIEALAATHTLLAQKGWTSLSLPEILRAELAPYADERATRIEVEDIVLSLKPRTAIALGLIIHELATNAVKYGALSRPDGRVAIREIGWSGGDGAFAIEWVETGGPEVVAPRRSGFGRTVIARSLGYSTAGRTQLEFLPMGVRCRIDIPAEDIVREEPA